MVQNRINLTALVEAVELHDAFENTPKSKIEGVIRLIFKTIEDTVINGGKVAIPSFGTFTKFTSSTTSKSKPKFTPSSTFKDKVNA